MLIGIDDDLINPHFLYLEPGNNQTQRLENYQAIIQNGLTIKTTNFIRDSTNKGLVLGDERFIDKLEKQIKRPIRFFSRGGDRKSERFKNQLL